MAHTYDYIWILWFNLLPPSIEVLAFSWRWGRREEEGNGSNYCHDGHLQQPRSCPSAGASGSDVQYFFSMWYLWKHWFMMQKGTDWINWNTIRNNLLWSDHWLKEADSTTPLESTSKSLRHHSKKCNEKSSQRRDSSSPQRSFRREDRKSSDHQMDKERKTEQKRKKKERE